jgi:methylglyoxal synthase
LEAQPHDPDIKALLRIATVYDIPVANNLATADFILHSKFMDQEYVHWIEDYEKQAQNRAEAFKK